MKETLLSNSNLCFYNLSSAAGGIFIRGSKAHRAFNFAIDRLNRQRDRSNETKLVPVIEFVNSEDTYGAYKTGETIDIIIITYRRPAATRKDVRILQCYEGPDWHKREGNECAAICLYTFCSRLT